MPLGVRRIGKPEAGCHGRDTVSTCVAGLYSSLMCAVAVYVRVELRRFIGRVTKSAFVKNVLVVMSGAATAQLIGFGLSPLISRLFTPADFGVFGSFGSVAGIIGAGATLEYTQAIMLPREKRDGITLWVLSCLSTCAVGALCLLAVLCAPAVLQGLMKADSYWVLWLLVAATVAGGLNRSAQAWCVRVKAFGQTSASQVIRAVSSGTAQVGFGWLRLGSSGLIVGGVLSDLVASGNLLRVVLPDFKALRQSITRDRMWRLAKEYRDFPMYAASQNVINAISTGLPVLLLTQFYGIAVAGAYAFGIRILVAPMGFVLTALRQVLFQKAAETQHHGGSLLPLYIKITAGLFAQGLLPALIVFLWAPQLFVLVFGGQWHLAGEFARSLVIWLLFAYCNLAAVLFARLIRIQRMFFFYDLLTLAGRSLSLVIGGYLLSAAQTVTLFAVVGAVMNAVLICLVGSTLMRKERRVTPVALRVS